MVIRKRQLLWDWTNSAGPGNPGVPQEMNLVPFGGNSPMASVVNWNAWVPPELKGRAPFRPMVHGIGNTTGQDWATIENTPYPIILFFNEPERAGISPEQARDIWYKQMLPLRHGKAKKLGSPAVAGDDKGMQWIQKWMQLVARDPPDYLCLHYYSNSGDAAIKYIQGMHAKYPAHPVMVTEIASIDRNYQSVLGFTIQVCNWMDQQSWVFEYGLFDFQRKLPDSFVSPAARLMEENGSFTQLGNMYLNEQPMKFPGQSHPPTIALVEQPTVASFIPMTVPMPPVHDPETDTESGPRTPESSEQSINGTGPSPHIEGITGGIESLAVKVETQLDQDQSQALKAHNDARAGKHLSPLTWDNTLANHAASWAQHLTQVGHLQHSTGAQRPGEGENLYWAWASNGIHNPLTAGAHGWLDEAKNYHGETIAQGNFESYGHYTQCMWHSTTKVGMAMAKDAKGGVYVVGRYSPPGNIVGQKPY